MLRHCILKTEICKNIKFSFVAIKTPLLKMLWIKHPLGTEAGSCKTIIAIFNIRINVVEQRFLYKLIDSRNLSKITERSDRNSITFPNRIRKFYKDLILSDVLIIELICVAWWLMTAPELMTEGEGMSWKRERKRKNWFQYSVLEQNRFTKREVQALRCLYKISPVVFFIDQCVPFTKADRFKKDAWNCKVYCYKCVTNSWLSS